MCRHSSTSWKETKGQNVIRCLETVEIPNFRGHNVTCLMKYFLALMAPLLVSACGSGPSEPALDTAEGAEETSVPTIRAQWQTDTTLRTPESVLYDPDYQVIYVANVNLNPWEKDGNGFISKLDLRGQILDLQWVTDLHGPKGMGIRDGSLFVADIDEVVEIDRETGKIIQRYPVEGTPTLNDITVGGGVVYISGSDSNRLFALRENKVELVMESDFGRPNGLFAEEDRLLMITSNTSMLKSIDLENREITDLVGDLGHGDGIVPVGNGDYLASSWRGQLFYVTSDWQRYQLLDTRDREINAADIDYVIDKNLLLVPTFFDNRVVAYALEK